jgi:hypothetical protein
MRVVDRAIENAPSGVQKGTKEEPRAMEAKVVHKGIMEELRVAESELQAKQVMVRHASEEWPAEMPVKAVVPPQAAVKGEKEAPAREGWRRGQQHRTKSDSKPPMKGHHGRSPLLTMILPPAPSRVS